MGTLTRFYKQGFILIGCVVILALGGVALLAGCSQSDAQIQRGVPDWIGEKTALAQTYDVIEEFNEYNYEAVAARFDDGSVTAEDFDEALGEVHEEFGLFESYGEVVYYNGESSGESYVTVVQEAVYENGLAEFRISFFEDGSLAGFYFLIES